MVCLGTAGRQFCDPSCAVVLFALSFFLNGLPVTGKLENYSRDELKEILIGMGANVTSSVSSKTSLLIAGEKAGSKLRKAKSLDIDIINSDQCEEFLNDTKKFI